MNQFDDNSYTHPNDIGMPDDRDYDESDPEYDGWRKTRDDIMTIYRMTGF